MAEMTDIPTSPGAAREPKSWRCFQCDEVFTDEACARLHFGEYQDCDPICKVGAEHYRDLENQLATYRTESDETSKTFYRIGAEHAQALKREEEKGYARGLADARARAPAPLEDQTEPAAECNHEYVFAEGEWECQWCGAFAYDRFEDQNNETDKEPAGGLEKAASRLELWLRYGNPRPNPISDEGRQFENDLQLVLEQRSVRRVGEDELAKVIEQAREDAPIPAPSMVERWGLLAARRALALIYKEPGDAVE